MHDPDLRRRIAHELLGCAPDRDGFAPCPGRSRHTSRDGRRDFVVKLDGAPTAHCLHASCADLVDAFNHELRRRVALAESGNRAVAEPMLGAAVPAAPGPLRASKRPPYDATRLADFAARCPAAVTLDWLAERSPVRDDLVPIVCPLGADGGALSAVRLSRLPGCQRHGKRDRDGGLQRYDRPHLQRLVWLNPAARAAPILDIVPR